MVCVVYGQKQQRVTLCSRLSAHSSQMSVLHRESLRVSSWQELKVLCWVLNSGKSACSSFTQSSICTCFCFIPPIWLCKCIRMSQPLLQMLRDLESVFSVFPQITDPRPVQHQPVTDKNTKSSQRLSILFFFVLPQTIHWRGSHGHFQLSCWHNPQPGKRGSANYLLSTRVVTNVCKVKGSLYRTHILYMFSHFLIF